MHTDEKPFFGPWVDAFTTVFRQPPTVSEYRLPELGDEPLFHVTFPSIFDYPALVGGWGAYRGLPNAAAYFRRMGFDWNAEQMILTAPTPHTFNALLPVVAAADCGFRMDFLVEETTNTTLAPWLLRYMDGVIPIHVAPSSFYDHLLREGPDAPIATPLKWHLQALPHDLTVHALNYHRVPKSAIALIAERIRAALPERVASWRSDGQGAKAPLTLAYFYDNDLNRFCYEVWQRVARPEDFGAVFLDERNLAQLLAVLDTRIEETRDGKGDVESGQSQDMPPLHIQTFRCVGTR